MQEVELQTKKVWLAISQAENFEVIERMRDHHQHHKQINTQCDKRARNFHAH
jgi:hypothetical protein